MATTPQIINPVGNPIFYKVSSANHIEENGVFASLVFVQSAAFNVGTSLELNVLNKVLHFDFVASPDDSGFQLKGWESGMPWSEWWDLYIAGLKSNYYLSTYYSITTSSTTGFMSISSKAIGEEYNIDFEGANPSQVSNVNQIYGVDEIRRANFGIHARIIDAETLSILGEDRIASNEALFDFSEFLKAWVSSSIFYPEILGVYPVAQDQAVKEFYIEYWEKANDYFSKVNKTENYKAVCGGLNKKHEQLIDAGIADYLSLFKSNDFLVQTARPLISSLSLNQPLHFYVINTFEETKVISPEVILHYDDATSHTVNLSLNVTTPAWQQAVFILSPSLHSFADINPNKTISYISVQIQADSGQQTSDLFMFKVIRSPQEQCLCVKNSHGAFDYIPFFGISQNIDKYNRTTFENSNNELFSLHISENQELTLNSGWITKEERDWYRDILQSGEVYLVNGNVLEQYVITTGESLRLKDKDYLFGLEIKMRKSTVNNFYSQERNPIPSGADSGFVIGTDDYIISDGTNDIGLF